MSEEQTSKRGMRGLLGRFRARSAAEKRRMLVVGGAVALAILTLVIVPGYLASRSSFVQRYASLESRYDTWAASSHAAASCAQCHTEPSVVARVGYDARMLGEFYLSMVMPSREPALFGAPSNGACLRCHMDLRTVSPSGDLNIPHRAHVEILKMECVSCHDELVHTTAPAGTARPSMEGCLTCHNGETAKADCDACHTDKAEPMTHLQPDWLVVHAQKVEGGDCNRCHDWTDHWCADCHQKRPASHSDTWRAEHGDRVKDRRNCEACHTGEFCVRCHGVVPQVNFDPTLTIAK